LVFFSKRILQVGGKQIPFVRQSERLWGEGKNSSGNAVGNEYGILGTTSVRSLKLEDTGAERDRIGAAATRAKGKDRHARYERDVNPRAHCSAQSASVAGHQTMPGKREKTSAIWLDYGKAATDTLLGNISAAAMADRYLWTASDEGRTVDVWSRTRVDFAFGNKYGSTKCSLRFPAAIAVTKRTSKPFLSAAESSGFAARIVVCGATERTLRKLIPASVAAPAAVCSVSSR
jgi:hypothetical protein